MNEHINKSSDDYIWGRGEDLISSHYMNKHTGVVWTAQMEKVYGQRVVTSWELGIDIDKYSRKSDTLASYFLSCLPAHGKDFLVDLDCLESYIWHDIGRMRNFILNKKGTFSLSISDQLFIKQYEFYFEEEVQRFKGARCMVSTSDIADSILKEYRL